MPKPITDGGLTWRVPDSLSASYLIRLDAILESWRGTPYMAGQQCRGVGADCVRFVCGILDEFYRRKPVAIDTLPHDAALHSRDGAIAAMRKIRDLYMPNFAVEDGFVEPGDVLITGPSEGGPGHAMIVGTKRNQLWHAAGAEVHPTGLWFYGEIKIFRVYRMNDRSTAC